MCQSILKIASFFLVNSAIVLDIIAGLRIFIDLRIYRGEGGIQIIRTSTLEVKDIHALVLYLCNRYPFIDGSWYLLLLIMRDLVISKEHHYVLLNQHYQNRTLISFPYSRDPSMAKGVYLICRML